MSRGNRAQKYRRIYRLMPLLAVALVGCTDTDPPPAPGCDAPPPGRCWTVQLDPNSSRTSRVCADPDEAIPAGWWRA